MVVILLVSDVQCVCVQNISTFVCSFVFSKHSKINDQRVQTRAQHRCIGHVLKPVIRAIVRSINAGEENANEVHSHECSNLEAT